MKRCRAGVALLLAAGHLALCLSTGSGCSGQAWQQWRHHPMNPAVWLPTLVPPEGESFYNEKSREIERSLNRKSNFEP